MKRHSLELQHIDHFMEKGFILFKDLISQAKVKQIKETALFVCKKAQRNSWQLSEILKKQYLHTSLASIASNLTRVKSLRFGFDHYFLDAESLFEFFKSTTTLSQVCSIDGLEAGLLLNLSATQLDEPCPNFPYSSGSGLYFNPQKPLDLTGSENAEGPFLLITYCRTNARYIFQPLDPFTHDGKKEGSVFGDLLSSKFHPLVHF